MPVAKIQLPDGRIAKFEVPEGTTPDQVTAFAQQHFSQTPAQPKQEKPFGQQLNEAIADIPRQVGLTARYGIEGVGDTLDFLSSPIRAGLNMVLPKQQKLSGLVTGQGPQDAIPSGSGRYLADKLGLPKPENATERVVGDVSRMVAGGAAPVGLAAKAAPLTQGVTQGVMQTLAANPLQQMVSAGASGGAGGYVRETGGNEGAQFLTALAAGVAAPYAMNKGQQLGQATNRLTQRMTSQPAVQAAQVDIQINNALRDSGFTLGDLPYNVQNSIRQDVQQALRTDGVLSPDAVRRLADYRLTGATPTAATLTLDPAMVTQQKNLAKLGVNSKDRAAQQLAQVENANNRQLITGLNDLGASQARGEFMAGSDLVNRLDNYATANRRNISSLYEAAKDSQGRAASLDPSVFANTANDLLDRNLKGAFVPENIRTMMNDFATGKIPLNIQTAEQFKTIVGNAQRGATDGNIRAALGHIREALDNTPLMGDALTPAKANGGFQLKPVGGLSQEMRSDVGQETLDAFNAARRANRSFMQEVENNPALAAAMDGVAPDQFFKRFVLTGPTRDLESMLNVVNQAPAARQGIKQEVVGYLKSQALNKANDEVGNFSQSAYNKALSAIGDQKLNLLFSREELSQLRAIGRVASYEQFQPKGSAVNNSNTAGATIATVLDRIAGSPLLSKIPFGNVIAGPAQNISVGLRSADALNASNALTNRLMPPTRQTNPLLLSPAAFMAGEDR